MIQELALGQRIHSFPTEEQMRIHRMRGLIHKIGNRWNSFPLYSGVLAIIGCGVWAASGGPTPDFGFGVWPNAAIVSLAIYFVVSRLALLLLYPSCKRYLDELDDEIATIDGQRALNFLSEHDEYSVWVTSRARRGNLWVPWW